jgi:hypothetical protein
MQNATMPPPVPSLCRKTASDLVSGLSRQLFLADAPQKWTDWLKGPSLADWLTAAGTLLLVAAATFAGATAYRQIKQTREQIEIASVQIQKASEQLEVARRQTELSREVEQSQTFLELTRRWNDPAFRKARIRIRNYYGRAQRPDRVAQRLRILRHFNETQYWECVEALNFFETVGFLTSEEKAITFTVVNDVWGFVIWEYWAMLYKFVARQRDRPPPDPRYCEHFQWLADKIATEMKYVKVWDLSTGGQGEGPGGYK